MLTGLVFAAVGVLLVVVAWASHFALRRHVRRRADPPRLERYPSVTVIRPIKGLDAGAEQNIRAAFNTGYPGEVDTIFVFDDASEPAVPLVRRAIVEHEKAGRTHRAHMLFCGAPPPGRTGKLNAMIAALEHAHGELVAFADSDIRPDDTTLTALVGSLYQTPGAGAAFAPVIVASEPQTAGDAGYALLLNGMYGPAAAASTDRNHGELPFIMGQYMVLRREAIAEIGGLESAEGELVDDMVLGARIKQAGFCNVVSPRPVPIIQHGMDLHAFLLTYVRWIAFSRTGLPGWAFKAGQYLRAGVFFAGLALAPIAAAFGELPAAFALLLAPLSIAASINALHHRLSGQPLPTRFFWVSLALLLVSPLVLAMIHLRHEVNWRGRTYRLGADSRLAERRHPAHANR